MQRAGRRRRSWLEGGGRKKCPEVETSQPVSLRRGGHAVNRPIGEEQPLKEKKGGHTPSFSGKGEIKQDIVEAAHQFLKKELA